MELALVFQHWDLERSRVRASAGSSNDAARSALSDPDMERGDAMSKRILGMALLLSVVVILGGTGPAIASGGGDGSVTRECEFKLYVPPFLKVSECYDVGRLGGILVETNTRTSLAIEWTDFKRYERSCDGEALKTWDIVPACLKLFFAEPPACNEEGGDACLETKLLSEGDHALNYCVNPHRGGYLIIGKVSRGDATPCDDAGCYRAIVKVTVSLNPFTDECE